MRQTTWQWAAFRRGFVAILPFWLAAAPFGLAYALAAQEAQLSGLETQLMSLFIFSAVAQMALVQLLSTDTSMWLILLTMLIMNLHHLLYGLSLNREIKLTSWQRFVTAFLLTDAAYGVTIVDAKKRGFSFLLGAGLSMFTAWNLFTGSGIWLRSVITKPPAVQLNFVVPLTFFLLLVLVIKTRIDLLVAVVSVGLTIIFSQIELGNATALLIGIFGSLLGLGISTRQERQGGED